jgi:hypothetical protein
MDTLSHFSLVLGSPNSCISSDDTVSALSVCVRDAAVWAVDIHVLHTVGLPVFRLCGTVSPFCMYVNVVCTRTILIGRLW